MARAIVSMLRGAVATRSACCAPARRAFSSNAAAAGASSDDDDDDNERTEAQALLRKAIAERTCTRFFASTPVPDATLAEVLRLTQRAPTGFNMQPYACVVVREQADREKLAGAMLATNGRKVKEAPVVVVFAADIEPSRRVPHIQKLMHDNGVTAAEVNNLPHFVRLFSGEGYVAGGIRSLISTVVSPLQAVPTDVPTIAWAYKQTAFAAATFLYAAQASGLATCPMEGFDETRLKHALDIPDRYSVPVVIACGYANPAMQRGADGSATPRLAPTEIFFDGKFGQSSAKLFE